MVKQSIRLCANLLNQYIQELTDADDNNTRNNLYHSTTQASNEHEASFHVDPANPVIKNLGKYQGLFHNAITSFLPHPVSPIL